MQAGQFRDEIVAPVLWRLGMWSADAESLMMATAVHESEGLRYVRQRGGGPAMGFFQVEPMTARDVIGRYFRDKVNLRRRFENAVMWREEWHDRIAERLLNDMAFNCAVARMVYWQTPEVLPPGNDVLGMAKYWKAHYQKGEGVRGIADFIADHERFIG